MEVFRRMKRAIDVVNIDYGVQRNQRSVECKNHDDDEACQYWAEKGFCVIRKDFMLEDCAKSCNSCRTGTTHPFNKSWGIFFPSLTSNFILLKCLQNKRNSKE